MNNFKQTLTKTKLSTDLTKVIFKYWQRIIASTDSTKKTILTSLSEEQHLCIIKFWAGSDFAAEMCIQNPAWLIEILQDTTVHLLYATKQHIENLLSMIVDVKNTQQLMDELRVYRNKQMLRIIWINHNNLCDMQNIIKDLSAMADACVTTAVNFLYNEQCNIFGKPMSVNDQGEFTILQKFVVLALGKLGSYELNLSSDIDLIFAYHHTGFTQGAPRSISNQIFFTKLAQSLIHVLNHVNDKGFVFRVDMRLRPYGDSGPLVMCFAELEQYYQDHGRAWERYAMLKARVIEDHNGIGKKLLKKLKPFIFRKYLDFSNMQSLRNIKTQIKREVKLKRMENNIKLGSGGIREIEFIIQTYQLIYGGRDKTLQVTNTLKALDLLDKKKYLPKDISIEIKNNYIFLRNLEHALQSMYDQQTQEYYTNPFLQERIAIAMHYDNSSQLNDKLKKCRKFIASCFNKIITKPVTSKEASIIEEMETIWLQKLSNKEACKLLIKKKFTQPEEILKRIHILKTGGTIKNVRRISQERLDKFIPYLFRCASESENPDLFFLRILLLVESVLKRTAYLVLLMENPKMLKFIGYVFSKSTWVTEQIIKYPQLLDDLLNINMINVLPSREQLAEELKLQLQLLEINDLDMQMEGLRHFKIFHLLRINIAQITCALPLIQISDYLTRLAEVIVEYTLQISYLNSIETPLVDINYTKICKNFIIVAYGKLGGIESSPTSDLDLVFIYEDNCNSNKDISYRSNFFTRLSHKITHILTTRTLSGKLYEVDTRLRPSGADGLLVSSIKGFEHYQHKLAWLWEHQALVRARVIAGDSDLANKFYNIREQVLRIKKDKSYIYNEILKMRKKIKQNYQLKNKRLYIDYPPDKYFNLKYADGGIIDIEFYIQMLVLLYANQHKELVCWSDNIRITQTLAKLKLLSDEQANTLITAYKNYRVTLHQIDLNKGEYFIKRDKTTDIAKYICDFWQEIEDYVVN